MNDENDPHARVDCRKGHNSKLNYDCSWPNKFLNQTQSSEVLYAKFKVNILDCI